MEQLYHDADAQNWSAIYAMPDPEKQLQHFNSIVLWLLDLNAPLRRYIKNDDVNPWFTFDIQKAIVERDLAYGKGGGETKTETDIKNKESGLIIWLAKLSDPT
jgi:hypothetical protein